MNKKEIAEIKKNFDPDSGLFVINSVLMAFVNGEKNVLCTEKKSPRVMEQGESEVLYESLKKVLSGSLGKNLTEYPFPKESYADGGAQKLLYSTLAGKLDDDEANSAFVFRIAENTEMGVAYTVICAHCTYTVLKKSKNDEITEDTDNDYNFLITALCPANTGDDGLFYDSNENGIFKKANTEMIIARAPQDGFLFPVFSDRAADVNSVMYYTRSPKKPNLTVIEDVLDGTFSYTADNEKEKFHQIIEKVCADELNYTVITQVNDIITDIIAQNTNETEPPTIDSGRMKTILSDAGVSDEKLEAVSAVYEEIVGEFALKASNLVDPKTVVSAESITVNIGKDANDKVNTTTIQGRKCLVIDLEDPTVTINGMGTSL